MQTARSASSTWSASRSAVEYTATASIPSSCRARITRTAISPRFATSTRSNMSLDGGWREDWLELEEELAVLDGLGVLDVDGTHHARALGLQLVEELHRLEDAEHLTRDDRVADVDEGRGSRLG